MALKSIVTAEEHAKLADPLKAEYTQVAEGDHKGKFMLTVEPISGFALEDVTGLKQTVSNLRTEVDTTNRKLKGFEGLDPAAVRKQLSEYDKMVKDGPPEERAKAIAAAREAELVTKHQRELEQREAALATERSFTDELLIVASATEAITQHKGNVELLMPHVMRHAKVIREEGKKPRAAIIDAKTGNERITTKSGSTDPMSVAELVAEMKNLTSFAPAFGSGMSGSGAGNPNAPGGSDRQGGAAFGGYAARVAQDRAAGRPV
jgi:hypothetical protein